MVLMALALLCALGFTAAAEDAIEMVPYEVLKTFENDIEERMYQAKPWATASEISSKKNMDTKSTYMFMSLFAYISGKNDQSTNIPMTAPVATMVKNGEGGKYHYEMGFYVPEKFQSKPPQPSDAGMKVAMRELHVYSIKFGGYAKEADYDKKLKELTSFLGSKGISFPGSDQDEPPRFYVGYDSPMTFENRRNEVWIMA